MTDAAYPAPVLAGRPDPRIRANILTVLLTSVAYFMVALDTLVVVTALPSIHRDLGGNVGTLQWTVNAYVLAFGAGIITAAAIGDLIGRRRGSPAPGPVSSPPAARARTWHAVKCLTAGRAACLRFPARHRHRTRHSASSSGPSAPLVLTHA